MAVRSFQTRRLRVQDIRALLADETFRDALEDDLAGLLTQVVLAELPPPLQLNPGPDAIRNWMNDRLEESDLLSVRDAATQEIAGLMILAEVQEGTIHIGYLLGEAYWGKGLATELVQGLVQSVSPSTTLLGGVGVSNPASARVLQKAGFTRDAKLSTPDTDMFARKPN